MKSFGIRGQRPDVRAAWKRARPGCRTRPRISVLVISPIIAVIIAGILFAVFNAALGGEASFKQVFARHRPRRRDLGAVGGVLRRRSIISAGATGSVDQSRRAAADAAGRIVSREPLLGMIDIFLIWYVVVLAIGLAVLYRRRTQPIAMSLLGVYAVIALVSRASIKSPGWGSMSRNKKILIGVGIVVVLGGIGLCQRQVQAAGRHRPSTSKRSRSAICRRSSRPRARSSRSGSSTSAPTRWAGSRISRSRKGRRVKKGQFLLQIDPRNLTSAVQPDPGVAGRRRLADGAAAASRRQREGGAEAGAGRATPASSSSGSGG